ncbi:hypothetical protein B0H13DRAFT_2302508 [Mycena leptocephala]|nr:hypothetical protein B0H13DRAFT_2302508 [Mycena leptocephala]
MPPLAPQFNPRFNSPDLSGSDDEQLTQVIVRCKRRIAELEAQINNVNGANKSTNQAKSYAALGRAVCKVVSTYDCVESLVAEDDRRRDLEDARTRGDDIHEEEPEPTMEFKKKMVSNRSKRNVAAIIGLKAVTGRSIAYAAVHFRFALSDAPYWDDKDGAFDYIQFYNNVVEYFEFPPGPRARADAARLLDWWNVNVFGTTPRWSLHEGRSDPSTSSVAIMRAARAARETGV